MKVAIETLGCKVNLYESEVIKGIFLDNNYEIVSLEDKPDVVVINTCSVTNQSDAKDRKIIRKAKRIAPVTLINNVANGQSIRVRFHQVVTR